MIRTARVYGLPDEDLGARWLVDRLWPRGVAKASLALAGWARATAPQAVTLLIGPEGGFSADEEAAALAQGTLALSMGPRVLRTETAGLAALATLNAAWAAD